MADYQRILSYLYRYEKAEKKECLGFVKAEQKSGNLKLTIQIDDERLLQGMELKLCFYEKQKEGWQVWQLDTLTTQEHKEELYLTYPVTTLPSGFRIKGQSGVLLYYQDAFYYGSVWIGEEIPAEVLEPLRWHKVTNLAKDSQEEAANKTVNKAANETADMTSEESLPDKENSVTDTDEENAEKSVEIKEVSAEVMGFRSKLEAKSKAGQKSEAGRKSELKKELASERKMSPELEPNSVSEVELKSELESESALKPEMNSESKSDEASEVEIKAKSESKKKLASDLESVAELEIKTKPESDLEPKVGIKAEPELESVDNFEKMWINFIKEKPPVDNIFNTAFYEGCRISSVDLAQLGKEAGSLAGNQFLLKGCERYHHILAGKVRYAGKKRYCIGVPGIYENREKYMAEIYQFPVFLSLTENRMKTGSFGYWLHLLSEVR